MRKNKLIFIVAALICALACVLSACATADGDGSVTTAGGVKETTAGNDGTDGTATDTDSGGRAPDDSRGQPTTDGTRIKLTFAGQTVYGMLDDNSVSRDLISRLPLTLEFSDYNGTEKIAYLPDGSQPWDVSDAPDSCTPAVGDITMYSPWGNLAIFYQPFRESSGLVPLGRLDDGGAEKLAAVSGDFAVTVALAEDSAQTTDSQESTASSTTTDKPEQHKILVAFFSCTGNTRAVAEKIAAFTGGDLYEIVPAEPYSSADLNYNNSSCRANLEMNDPAARPAIGGEHVDISEYDTVLIGYPIWWGTMPRIINTFLDTHDLSGKTVLPFCTSESSGVSTSVSAIRDAEPGANVMDGLRASGANDRNLEKWLRDSGAIK